jgi:hypothetical protein
MQAENCQEAVMIQRVTFPNSVTELRLLDHVSYSDAFVAKTNETRTAEEWMRRALAGVPRGLLAGVRAVQRMLGLELAPASPDRPLGWEILCNDPDIFVLGADGPGGSARLVGVVDEGQLVFTTQVDFGRRTRLIWTFAQFPHRAIARYLLGKAVRSPG